MALTRSFVPLAGGMEGSVSLACAPGVASVELLGRAPRLRRSGCSTEAASARPSPPGQVEACRLSQPKNMILFHCVLCHGTEGHELVSLDVSAGRIGNLYFSSPTRVSPQSDPSKNLIVFLD